MDISFVKHALKLKGKHALALVDDTVTVAGRAGEDEFRIDGAGEYEVKGVSVIGHAIAGATVYRIELEGVSVVYFQGVGRPLTTAELDQLDGVDVVCLPANDNGLAIVKELEPVIVIPVGDAAYFCKELGKDNVSPQPKLSVAKDKLPEALQVVVLS